MTDSKYPERRAVLLHFVTVYIAEHGGSPTAATLNRQLGWSRTTCQGYLRRMEAELPLPGPAQCKRDNYAFFRSHLLRLAQAYLAENGYAPAQRELAGEAGLSPTTLRRYLHRLQQEGRVDFQPGIARSLRVILIGDP